MKIAIGMPTVGGTLHTRTLSSIVATCQVLAAQRIGFAFVNVDFSEVVQARNSIAASFLNSPDYTHLLFVDYDMQYEPAAVQRMIAAGKPLVGCAYPKRHTDLERVEAVLREAAPGEHMTLERALSVANSYVLRQPATEGVMRMRLVNGLTQVEGVGMGLTLIAREVFERLIASGRIPKHSRRVASDIAPSIVHGFFDVIDSVDGHVLSEDFSFCEKWRRYCGGEVWCNVADTIGHYGPYGYYGRFLDKLRHAQALAETRQADAAAEAAQTPPGSAGRASPGNGAPAEGHAAATP